MSKKEKLTLEEKVAKRKVAPSPSFWWWLYGVLAKMPFFSKKYHPTYNIIDNPKDCPTGCFVIWNHQSRRDYLFLRVALNPRKFSMVAGYPEFFRSHLAPLFKLVRIVPKKPFYKGDFRTIANMGRLVKNGNIVTFSPEGTASLFGDQQPVTPGTAGFLKRMNAPVYCCDYRGLFLSSNKSDMKDKPGKCEITIYKLFEPEDLQKMSLDEIDNKINEVFRNDDYEWNKVKQYSYKGKGRMTSNLEEPLYQCPKCKKMFTMVSSKNDDLVCKECGNGFRFDTKYNMYPLTEDAVLPSTPSKWTQWERQNIIKEIRKDPNYEFKGHYMIGGLPKYHYLRHHALCELEGDVDFIINHEGIHIIGNRYGEPYERHLSYQEVYSPNLEDDFKTLTFYPDGVSTNIVVDDGKGGMITMLIQEMHRLHVNTWKNFPWFDYMYENLDDESELR